MAGDNAKPPSNKRPHSSSNSERKSRWESSSPATNTTTAGNSSAAPTSKSSKSNPGSSSDSKRPTTDKPTPRRGPNPNPSPNHPNPSPVQTRNAVPPFQPSLGPPPPPPPPTYGFHMLDRRTIVLADGSVRSYFALPPDYQDLPPMRPPFGGPELGRFPPFGPMSPGERGDPFAPNMGRGPEGFMKRKFGEGEGRERDERDEFARRRQQLLHFGNAGANLGTGPSSPFRREDEFRSSKYMKRGDEVGFENHAGKKQEIDPAVLKAFLNFAKVLNENTSQRKNYLDNGKHGPLKCVACDRSSKDFPDVHSLMLHTYYSDNADLRVDHLGLHKALCVLMGWNYLRPPDNSKLYQFLSAHEAAANQDDLILWPPTVIIHNTNTGKGKDGRMEGLGNKIMDNKMRDLGFPGGKSKSLYCRDGHLGITLIKFASDQSGLKEAMRLADHFEQGHHGRRDWAHAQSIVTGEDDESNPNLVVVDERTGERRRLLYGYLGTASDMDKLDYETRKKIVIESKHEKLHPQPPK